MVLVDVYGKEESLGPALIKFMKSKGYEKVGGHPDFSFEKGRRRMFYIGDDFKDKFFWACFISIFLWGMTGGFDEDNPHDIVYNLIASPIAAYIGAVLFKWRFGGEAKWLVERICDVAMGSRERIYVNISSVKGSKIGVIVLSFEKSVERDAESVVSYLKTVDLFDKA